MWLDVLDGPKIVFGIYRNVAPLDHVDASVFDELAQLLHFLPFIIQAGKHQVLD